MQICRYPTFLTLGGLWHSVPVKDLFLLEKSAIDVMNACLRISESAFNKKEHGIFGLCESSWNNKHFGLDCIQMQEIFTHPVMDF